jgi:transposase
MILGIDVSKEKVDVALFDGKQAMGSGLFVNTEAGFKKLSKWLKNKGAGPVWICLEATGSYGEQLAEYFFEAGHQVSVVNPARIKKYAESQLRRNKNDKIDAVVIADFCRTQEPPLWTPPPPQKRDLQEMIRRLDALIEQRTRETNRLKSGQDCEAVLESLHDSLVFLDQQIAKLETRIRDHIDQHPDLKQEFDLLKTITGIGDKTASKLMAELPAVSRFDHVGQVVAYAGLSPQQHTSGSSVHKKSRLTKIGKQSLKKAMYFPALSALRFNPVVKALAARLEARDKDKMVIVGAAMRKLLQIVYGVLKSGKPFDPNYANLSQVTA